MSLYHGLALAVLALMTIGILIVSRRRVSLAERQSMLREIAADDPSTATESVPSRFELKAHPVLEFRKFLRATWGEDAPDLVYSEWGDLERDELLAVYDQYFFPLKNGAGETVSTIEDHLRESSRRSSLPQAARLHNAWTFIYIPEKRRDFVVRTSFHPSGFRHQFFLLENDGTLSRILNELDDLASVLFAPFRISYRSALEATLQEGDDAAAREELSRLIATDMTHAPSHAWLANISRRNEEELYFIRRHLNFANEFGANHLVTQIEMSYVSSGEQEPPMLRRVARKLAELHDEEGVLPFLLAQSFLALKNGRISRLLCERLLTDHPKHRHATVLMKEIDQRERGAQT